MATRKVNELIETLYVYVNLEKVTIEKVEQGENSKELQRQSINFFDGIKNEEFHTTIKEIDIKRGAFNIDILDLEFNDGIRKRCCWGICIRCDEIERIIAVHSYNESLDAFELDYLGYHDSKGCIQELEPGKLDRSAIKTFQRKRLSYNLGVTNSRTCEALVVDQDGNIWQ